MTKYKLINCRCRNYIQGVSKSASANTRKQVEYSKLNRKVLYHFTIFAIIIEIFNIKVRQIRAHRDTMKQALEL